MPQPDLFAIRNDLDLKEGQIAKLITFTALDDIAGRRRPRWQWVHPGLAQMLQVEPQYVALLQGYLEYRGARRGVSTSRGLRLHQGGGQIYDIETDESLGLLEFKSARADKTAQMAELLREAATRKLCVGGDLTLEAERVFSRACRVSSWDSLSEVYYAQRAAQRTAHDLRIAA
ncbi:hypothetical protein ACWD7M_16470 [Streptomyces griseus]